MISKIATSYFKNKYEKDGRTTFYHTIQFEGDDRPYSIGSKQQDPPFLAVGQSLEWEFYDETKGTIKRKQKPFGGASVDPVEAKAGIIFKFVADMIVEGKINGSQVAAAAKKFSGIYDEVKSNL